MGVCLTWICRIEINYKKMETKFVKRARIRGWRLEVGISTFEWNFYIAQSVYFERHASGI